MATRPKQPVRKKLPRPAPRKNSPQSRLGRQLFLFVVILGATIVLVAAITGERGYMDVRRQRASLSKLRAEVGALRRENLTLLADVRALKHDPYIIEKIAREKLGYAKPGELVFQFQPKHPSVPAVPQPLPPGEIN
jgi:cell division protein FtsB